MLNSSLFVELVRFDQHLDIYRQNDPIHNTYNTASLQCFHLYQGLDCFCLEVACLVAGHVEKKKLPVAC